MAANTGNTGQEAQAEPTEWSMALAGLGIKIWDGLAQAGINTANLNNLSFHVPADNSRPPGLLSIALNGDQHTGIYEFSFIPDPNANRTGNQMGVRVDPEGYVLDSTNLYEGDHAGPASFAQMCQAVTGWGPNS